MGRLEMGRLEIGEVIRKGLVMRQWGRRPFFIICSSLFLLLVLLVVMAPVILLTSLLPMLDIAEAAAPLPVSQEADIVSGRKTWLFVLKSEVGEKGEGMVVQYLHWYPDADVAAANWARNKNGSQDKFPGDPAQYRVPVEGGLSNVVLLCVRENGRSLCEYRAQSGHWTIHADFVTHNGQTFSSEQIENLATQMGAAMANHE